MTSRAAGWSKTSAGAARAWSVTATSSRPCWFLLARAPPQPAPPSPSRLCWHLVAACLGNGWILSLKGEPAGETRESTGGGWDQGVRSTWASNSLLACFRGRGLIFLHRVLLPHPFSPFGFKAEWDPPKIRAVSDLFCHLSAVGPLLTACVPSCRFVVGFVVLRPLQKEDQRKQVMKGLLF